MKTMRIPAGCLTGALVLGALIAASAPARGGWVDSSDCFFGFKDFYGSNETVCATGTADFNPGEFIFPEARVCVTANRAWSSGDGIDDVTAGDCNVVVGSSGGGAFFDEPVWQPPLTEGRYDMVLDDDKDDIYTAGVDDVCGAGSGWCFQVGAPVANPVDLTEIKDKANLQFDRWNTIATKWHWVEDVNSLASIGTSVVGNVPVGTAVNIAGAVEGFPTDYNSAILHIGGKVIVGLAKPQAERWATLRDDPPDPNFTEFAALDFDSVNAQLAAQPGAPGIIPGPFAAYPFTAITADPLHQKQIELLNLMAVQSALSTALTVSTEKYQGAEIAGDVQYTMLQARAMNYYADLLGANLTETRQALLDYKADLDAAGLAAVTYDAAGLQTLLDRINATGLTTAEETSLRAAGFGDADIAALLDRVATLPAPTADFARGSQLDDLVAAIDATTPVVASYAAEAEAVVTQLGPFVFETHPVADAGGPYAGDQGALIALDGSGSTDPNGEALVYGWDLDGDGVFDDASGSTPGITFDVPFDGPIGLEVTDPGGLTDIDYAALSVAAANQPPVITTFEPVAIAPTASTSSPLDFSVTATDADMEPLTYQWTLDGAVVSTATAWTYTPGIGDTGTRTVRVTVSDTSPLSGDTAEQRVVLIVDGATDSDGDGVPDNADNCTEIENADQRDTDGDAIGNACDADITNDCQVNFGDLAALKSGFFPRPYNPDADFDGDGFVNFGDLATMKATFFNGPDPGPGPSGLPNGCNGT